MGLSSSEPCMGGQPPGRRCSRLYSKDVPHTLQVEYNYSKLVAKIGASGCFSLCNNNKHSYL